MFHVGRCFHNISTIIDKVGVEYCRQIGYWADEYYRPLLCELEDIVIATYRFVSIVTNGRRLLELINDVIFLTDVGGILMQIKKRSFNRAQL